MNQFSIKNPPLDQLLEGQTTDQYVFDPTHTLKIIKFKKSFYVVEKYPTYMGYAMFHDETNAQMCFEYSWMKTLKNFHK